MFRTEQTVRPGKKKMPSRLIAGLAAFLTTGIITASGFAAAAPMDKPTTEQCEQAGYKNYGQCVKEWATNKPKPGGGNGGGGGYGGGNTTVNTNINLTLNNSNNNVIQVIVHILSH